MNITKPVVTPTSNGKYISSNSPEQKNIVIKPPTTNNIDNIEITISWSTLAGCLTDIISMAPALIAASESSI